MFPRAILPCILAPIAALVCASASHAQVRRCSGSDGSSIYTDRKCADIGAVDRLPRPAGSGAGAARLYRTTCSRNLQDLVYEITTAIDSRDVNRLAGVYHWVGMSSRGGYSVMRQLDGISKRPLVDIIPIAPVDADGVDGNYYPQTAVRRAPTGLRLEQTLANGSTPSRTLLRLRRHMGCWWVSL